MVSAKHPLAKDFANTAEIWFDNMLDSPESWAWLEMVGCAPFDELYKKHDVSVTTLVQNGRLHVAVGTEGSAEVVWEGPFNSDTDFRPAAIAVVNEICKIVDDETLNSVYFG